MGIDWEEILGAEGEDMADAYDDAIPDVQEGINPDDYYNTDYDSAHEELSYDEMLAEERAEQLKELYEDEQTPKDYDGLLNAYFDALEENACLNDSYENDMSGAQMVICQELKDLKKLLAVLREHNIAIPEGIEKRYQNRSNYELMDPVHFAGEAVEEDVKELVWKIQEEGEKVERPVPVYEDGEEPFA